MAILAIGKAVEQPGPVLRVDNPLPPGRHRFSLVVLDSRGIESEPVTVVVTVRPAPPARPRAGHRGLPGT